MQEIQHTSNCSLIILTQLFVLDLERLNANLLKKTIPDLLLPLCFFKRLFDQRRVKSRLSFRRFPFLHFPKTRLKRARCGECLPEFMAAVNVYKTKARERILQQPEIIRHCVAEGASISQPDEEIVQIPAH